ncbi:MAG TPA: ribosomal protein S18-alanine N-acetyltransferase [Firmicutes bacterium]|uniref:[Ribosomal protein bS18]-alanine N-acetyltransferase n=1 Tax=Capillibacterium thermochitinicola TaxID=2699427 RepID=A0A8J6LIH3_9FIRM|nr:ribosomal protein S18-alanine N-acetyltransferase [Capillibacterium thermochitinicola]MBA2132631.1 ribosomal protein S18-alanine N-acetyltransferase [Capillibacterium thermochitinicola]HHW12804.1 ribosomal protein S18-alanine N-acetyltransferase [Bacillota bacterium]
MFQVKPMTLDDLPEVLAIEEQCFPVPWSRSAFLYELLENERAYYCVAKTATKVVGYVGMWVILDEGHITNLAVDPAYRRKGIGRALLEHLITEGKKRGVRFLTLEVRSSNLVAQQLYRKLGFYEAGVRPGYYQDNQEDAIIMWKGPL